MILLSIYVVTLIIKGVPFYHDLKETDPLYAAAVDNFKRTFNAHNNQNGQNPSPGQPKIERVAMFINPRLYDRFQSLKHEFAYRELEREGKKPSEVAEIKVRVQELFHGTDEVVR